MHSDLFVKQKKLLKQRTKHNANQEATKAGELYRNRLRPVDGLVKTATGRYVQRSTESTPSTTKEVELKIGTSEMPPNDDSVVTTTESDAERKKSNKLESEAVNDSVSDDTNSPQSSNVKANANADQPTNGILNGDDASGTSDSDPDNHAASSTEEIPSAAVTKADSQDNL